MTTFPKARRDDAHSPSWLRAARAYYGDAFEAKKKTDLAAAMADWSDMDPDERGFVLAHLQYLNLLAQRDTHRLLLEIRASVEVIGDELIEAVELAGGEPDEDLLEGLDDERGAAEIEPMILDDEPVLGTLSRPTLVAVPDAAGEEEDQGEEDDDSGPAPEPDYEPAPEPA